MQELVAKRTRNSKTHSLGGRKYAWDGTIGSVHYKDAQDVWQNIDNEFLPVSPPWDWQMLKAGYHIRVKEDFAAGQIIEFEKQGETVQFQPMALEWTNDLDQIQQVSMPQSVSPVITNPEVDLLPAVGMPSHQGTIRWDNAYGQGIDFEWRCTSTRLVKILEIESFAKLPAPQQYILDGGNPVLRLNLIFDPPPKQVVDILVDGQVWNQSSKAQTFDVIEFRKNGEVLWGFMSLRYWDNEGNEGQSVATLEKQGNKLFISIRVPYTWLQSAVYPVFIDANVDEQVGASKDDCRRIYTNSLWSTTTVAFEAGYYSGTRQDVGCAARFLNVTIPGGGIITLAQFKVTCRTSRSYTEVNTRLRTEADVNPSIFSTVGDFDGRTWTTEFVNWDNISAWTADTEYTSPDVKTCVQEVIDLGGWASGNALVILWDDWEKRSTQVVYTYREGKSYNELPADAPKLHIEYTVGVTHYGTATLAGIGVLAGIPRATFIGKATLAGVGTLSAVWTRIRTGVATLAGTGHLAASGVRTLSGVVALLGIGSLTVRVAALVYGAISLVGTGSLRIVASVLIFERVRNILKVSRTAVRRLKVSRLKE